MKKTLLTLIILIMVAMAYNASAQCTITPVIIPSGSTTICQGDSLQLNGDSAYVSYLWSTGETTSYIYVTTAGNYTVYVTDGSGCTGTSAVTVITVDQGPPQQIGGISGNITPCQGSTQTYVVANDTTATSYTWTLPGGWTGFSTSSSITVTIGANSGTIAVFDGNACGNSAANTLAVTVINVPPQSGSITGPINVCPGTVQTYSVASVNNATSYSWSLPNGWSGSSTTNTITVTVDSTSGDVSIVSSNSCGASPATILYVTVDTGTQQIPAGLATGTITSSTAVVTWIPDSVTTNYELRISPDSLNTWTTYVITPSSTYTFTGLTTATHYDVCIAAYNQCGNITSAWDCISFIDDQCSASFNLFADTTILHHYFITDTLTGIPPFTYLWSWGDTTYDTIPYPSHTYADSGFYTICLTVTDSAGCVSTYCDSNYHIMRNANSMYYINVIPNIMTAVKTVDAKNVISVYPNPATNTLTINSQLSSRLNRDNSQLIITDVTGREVYHQAINNTQSAIDISTWSKGVYIYEIRSGLQTPASIRGKFVKE